MVFPHHVSCKILQIAIVVCNDMVLTMQLKETAYSLQADNNMTLYFSFEMVLCLPPPPPPNPPELFFLVQGCICTYTCIVYLCTLTVTTVTPRTWLTVTKQLSNSGLLMPFPFVLELNLSWRSFEIVHYSWIAGIPSNYRFFTYKRQARHTEVMTFLFANTCKLGIYYKG